MRKPCACGGVVIANPLDPTPGVRVHRATEPHFSWSAREFPECESTATPAMRDLSVSPVVRPLAQRVLVGLGYEL